jgi:hypothetical protein
VRQLTNPGRIVVEGFGNNAMIHRFTSILLFLAIFVCCAAAQAMPCGQDGMPMACTHVVHACCASTEAGIANPCCCIDPQPSTCDAPRLVQSQRAKLHAPVNKVASLTVQERKPDSFSRSEYLARLTTTSNKLYILNRALLI